MKTSIWFCCAALGALGCVGPAYFPPTDGERPGGNDPEFLWPGEQAPPAAQNPAAPTDGGPAVGGEPFSSDPAAHNPLPDAVPPPLYARDGSVVSHALPGSVVEQDVLAHEMEPTDTGRMYILELYQQAIDERDALEFELENLTATLQKAQALQQAAEEATRVRDVRVTELEAELAAMQAENLDLAARLTTAQIRRLEAEKLLLESKLEWLRQNPPPDDPLGAQAQAPPPSMASGTLAATQQEPATPNQP